jgi:hypothetical protein
MSLIFIVSTLVWGFFTKIYLYDHHKINAFSLVCLEWGKKKIGKPLEINYLIFSNNYWEPKEIILDVHDKDGIEYQLLCVLGTNSVKIIGRKGG